jgi:signal peptidase I
MKLFRKVKVYFVHLLKPTFLFFLFIIIFNFIKIFLFDVFYVPSDSMEGSLYKGDYIIVNKINYGPRWPQSPLEISWFNLFAFHNRLNKWFRNTQWSYTRWPKINTVLRDDILVFNHPNEPHTVLVKRCKGLPGDEIKISDDSLFINNQVEPEPKTVSYTYEVLVRFFDLHQFDSAFTSKYPMVYNADSGDMPDYRLHPFVAGELMRAFGDTLVTVRQADKAFFEIYPRAIVVPESGMTMYFTSLPKDEISYYLQLLNLHEGTSAEFRDEKVFINGKERTSYMFKHNYYFMMGDNRSHSSDSRHWGLIPEECIIGQATLVAFSTDTKKNRMLKVIL